MEPSEATHPAWTEGAELGRASRGEATLGCHEREEGERPRLDVAAGCVGGRDSVSCGGGGLIWQYVNFRKRPGPERKSPEGNNNKRAEEALLGFL